ncbi:unnamed protein product [Blepharisma stoltei]|uniref:WWE domain-containing protein n=1 Tax=Blepharisma stoltei TaxID=1481888 RepID=A0AAU9JPE2_9CILI|nr:unnamed protein product [Blepharisma stoltei]
MNCTALNCPFEAEYFCSCDSKWTMLCKEHVYYHIGDLHQLSNLYYFPSIDERNELASNLCHKIKDLEAQKANKIKESYIELEKIKNNLKNIVDYIDKDISNLYDFLTKIFAAPKYSRFDKICSLFNSNYEDTMKALKEDKFINPQNYSTEIIPNFLYFDNLLCQDLSNLQIALNEGPKKVIWSKLGENGEFVPYSHAENERIENDYQNGQDRSYIGDRNSQCYVNLKCPKIEVQEITRKAVAVIRNDGSRISDSNKNLNSTFEKQWYFKGDKGWEKMTSEASRVAEWALDNNIREVWVQNRNSYKIYVNEKKQINLQTNYKRDIKRGRSLENKKKTTDNTERVMIPRSGYRSSSSTLNKGYQTDEVSINSDFNLPWFTPITPRNNYKLDK